MCLCVCARVTVSFRFCRRRVQTLNARSPWTQSSEPRYEAGGFSSTRGLDSGRAPPFAVAENRSVWVLAKWGGLLEGEGGEVSTVSGASEKQFAPDRHQQLRVRSPSRIRSTDCSPLMYYVLTCPAARFLLGWVRREHPGSALRCVSPPLQRCSCGVRFGSSIGCPGAFISPLSSSRSISKQINKNRRLSRRRTQNAGGVVLLVTLELRWSFDCVAFVRARAAYSWRARPVILLFSLGRLRWDPQGRSLVSHRCPCSAALKSRKSPSK